MTRETFDRLADALDKVKFSSDGSFIARCPGHEDNNPSFSATQQPDGSILFHCFAGCIQKHLKDSIRGILTDADFGPDDHNGNIAIPNVRPAPDFKKILGAEPAGFWPYRDSAGHILWYQCRIDSADGNKTFRPVSWGGNRWIAKAPPSPRPLFDLHVITSRNPDHVLIVEGEKTAEAAKSIFPNLIATTWSNGANAVGSVDLTPLKGRKVTIWPDADEAGRRAATELSRRLLAIGCEEIRVVKTHDLPQGWDLADEPPQGIDLHDRVASAASIDPTLVSLMMTASELRHYDIPDREYVIEPFLAADSLSMVYAKRGLGKTWFALSLALAVAHGQPFLSYEVPKARRVLFIDGEMSMADLKSRLVQLNGPETDDLLLLPSEKLFREATPLNINNEEHQKLIIKSLERLENIGKRPSLIILDNLSSLGGGVDENDNSALDRQLQWLISLRHLGYAITLVHHAGKSGDQRGASRREDVLDTSIKLEPVDRTGAAQNSGAICDLEFVKTRDRVPQPSQMRLELTTLEDGSVCWTYSGSGKVPPYLVTLYAVLKGKRLGFGAKAFATTFETQSELAQKVGVVKGTISKHIKKLRDLRYVYVDEKFGVRVTIRGLDALRDYYDDVGKHIDSITVFTGEQRELDI